MNSNAPPFKIDLPSGLDRALMLILSRHIGRAAAISRVQLCTALKEYRITERQLREQIKLLRRSGRLIGSAPGVSGGYYLIVSLDEFNDFMQTEYLAKVKDMSETARAMTRTAQHQWGAESVQMTLF